MPSSKLKATVLKYKIASLILVVFLTGVITLTFIAYGNLIKHTETYIVDGLNFTTQMTDGYQILGVVGLSDLPGIAGTMGRKEAKEYAEKLRREEDDNVDWIFRNFTYRLLNSSVADCVVENHNINKKLIDQLGIFSSMKFVDFHRYDQALDDVQNSYNKKFECYLKFAAAYPNRQKTKNVFSDAPQIAESKIDSNPVKSPPISNAVKPLTAKEVDCPAAYTAQAINDFYMTLYAASFQDPNKDTFVEAKQKRSYKQPLWLKNVFYDPANSNNNTPACYSYNGSIYAYQNNFQPHNATRTGAVIVDLENKYAAIFSQDPDNDVYLVDGAEDKTKEVLKAVGFFDNQ